MSKWKISTVDQAWTVVAPTPRDAIKEAWTRRPPKSVGVLVEVRPVGKPIDDIIFVTGEAAVRWAGFQMEE